jgi:hypothetical protein
MGARDLDPILSIEYTTDPMWYKFPSLSPYNAMGNNPIMFIDPDGSAVVDALGSPPHSPYMRTVSDCFDSRFSTLQSNGWHSIFSVIPKNKFIGWGYNNVRNCYTLANFQLSVAGYSSTSTHYQAYTEQKGVNKAQAQKAVDYITKSLLDGKPVMVGVDDADGHPGNADKTTDHWIVIVGMDSDEKGNYFNFYDNATPNQKEGTSLQNKLYYDAESGKITGTADNSYFRNYTERDYTVTRIKETNNNNNE